MRDVPLSYETPRAESLGVFFWWTQWAGVQVGSSPATECGEILAIEVPLHLLLPPYVGCFRIARHLTLPDNGGAHMRIESFDGR